MIWWKMDCHVLFVRDVVSRCPSLQERSPLSLRPRSRRKKCGPFETYRTLNFPKKHVTHKNLDASFINVMLI